MTYVLNVESQMMGGFYRYQRSTLLNHREAD